MLRCECFERFLHLLEEKMFVAKWSNQHDALAVFLNTVILKGDLTQIEKRNAEDVLIDILHANAAYELKKKQAINLEGIPSFIEEYYSEIVSNKLNKTHWWLTFFLEREDMPKTTLGEICSYYLVLVEIAATNITMADNCRQQIINEVMTLVQEVEKRVREEDQVKKGIFAPVDNYIVVERLRKQSARQSKTIKQQSKALQEKDKALQEKDKELNALKAELARKQEKN